MELADLSCVINPSILSTSFLDSMDSSKHLSWVDEMYLTG